MNIAELLESVIARTGRTIYGEPVTAEGRTIIPAAKVAYGFGMGSGPKKEGAQDAPGGGGGGLRGKPSGYIEITAERTRFVRIIDYQEVAIALAMGFAAGFLFGHARR